MFLRPPKYGGLFIRLSVFMNSFHQTGFLLPHFGSVVFIDHAEGLSYNQVQADYPLVAPAKPLL
jgi:hypothetical protein